MFRTGRAPPNSQKGASREKQEKKQSKPSTGKLSVLKGKSEPPKATQKQQQAARQRALPHQDFSYLLSNPNIKELGLLQEFVTDRGLVEKSYCVERDISGGSLTITVSFRKVGASGIILGERLTMSIDEFAARKADFLQTKARPSRLVGYLARLKDRIQLDLIEAPFINYSVDDFISFVEELLSPAVITLLRLSDSEWQSCDSDSIKGILENWKTVVNEHLGEKGPLQRYIIDVLTTRDASRYLDKIDWSKKGMLPVTKDSLLKALRIMDNSSTLLAVQERANRAFRERAAEKLRFEAEQMLSKANKSAGTFEDDDTDRKSFV